MRLAEGNILVEQVRILLAVVDGSVAPVFVIVSLLVSMLISRSNALNLAIWAVAVVAVYLFWYVYARRQRQAELTQERARRVIGDLIQVNVVKGTLWGTLLWIVLDSASVAGTVLVLSMLAGMAAAAIATQAHVREVYLAFLLPEVSVPTAKLLSLGDTDYFAFIVTTILFAAFMYVQSTHFARTVLVSIKLRLENSELLEKLRLETGIAEAARKEADQANAAKSKFLAAASHDLRQPIHAQGLFLEVLARTELSPAQRELVASVSAASDASAEMLNTLLDFSRIEAGVIEPQLQAFWVQPLLNKIEREFVQQADAKGLEYRSRESTLLLQSDPALVELILRNLVSNAIRYTERGGLLVTCRQRGSSAVLEVYDTGIGIETSQQRAVFREFHQLGNPERDRSKGLGLGLAIVEGLARTLGHALSLDSQRGSGSVFRVTLPIATKALPLVPAVAQWPAAHRLNVRVLVVDDDESVRNGMLHLLRGWGCACKAAETIEDALTIAREWVPEVVISDYRLREQRTGVEAIMALRALWRPDLPALLITGDTAPERLREAVASGLPLLHKPVSPSRLYRGLVMVLPS